jgi:hypothetical protein
MKPKENKMGLDTTHEAWHGAYSAFMRWREKIAEVAGLPPLQLMEGFYQPINGGATYGGPPTMFCNGYQRDSDTLKRLDALLPIKWAYLKPSPLHELLFHSDCDGEIPAERCGPIAVELQKLMPLLPQAEGGGHIGNWRDKTQQFINGLLAAAQANEPLGFH